MVNGSRRRDSRRSLGGVSAFARLARSADILPAWWFFEAPQSRHGLAVEHINNRLAALAPPSAQVF